MSEFTCSHCLKTYEKTWSDYEASEEFLELYPECKNDPTGILCDDCNKKFKKWFSTLTTEEKKKIRERVL